MKKYTMKDKNAVINEIWKNRNIQDFLDFAFCETVFCGGGVARFQEILERQNFFCDFSLASFLFKVVKIVNQKRIEKAGV